MGGDGEGRRLAVLVVVLLLPLVMVMEKLIGSIVHPASRSNVDCKA